MPEETEDLLAAAPMSKTVFAYGDFQVNEFITRADFAMVDFDKNDLDKGFSQNPGVIAYFGHMLGRAKRQTANFKTRRDAVKSNVARMLRDDIMKAEKKAPSEQRVESEMRSQKEFLQVSYGYNHALEVEETISALYWAARGRRSDMEFFADKQRTEMSAKAYSISERGKNFNGN